MAKTLGSSSTGLLKYSTIIVVWAGMFVFIGHACTHMVAAGDTWVALACGRHFVNHGVDTIEPFSANSHEAGPNEAELEKYPAWLRSTVKTIHPSGWVNQNWLTHVIFYKLVTFFDGDYNALIYWKFAVTIMSAVVIYYTGRVFGAGPLLAAIFTSFALFIGRTFIDVRPAVFTNTLVPLFMLTIALATYRNIRYIWLLVPLTVLWCNVHGGFIYIFIMLVPYVGINLLTCMSKTRFVSIGLNGLKQTVLAGSVALLASITFNPFHLTNVTHTFEISFSKHAAGWRLVNEWRPAFDWMDRMGVPNPVGQEEGFGVMCILAMVIFVVWFIALFFKPVLARGRRARQEAESCPGNYQWPKIDLSVMVISALTAYMALRSRRFIPIAAAAACPVMAMFVHQAYCMIAARVNFNKRRKLEVPAVGLGLSAGVLVIFAIAIVCLGVFWGKKYKRIYLDPWAKDDIRNSVFMRMTASNVKPFDACQFIRENELSGKMFNHWTEGGAIAYGQEPDAETGKTPLKLFMDGRAQAAYSYEMFGLWRKIKAGGPAVQNAGLARRKLTERDFVEIGDWIDKQMKHYDVWAVLQPSNQVPDPRLPAGELMRPDLSKYIFVRGLQKRKNWATAYVDLHQQLFVDTDTEQGRELMKDVLSGEAKFPTEFSKHYTIARNLLGLSDQKSVMAGAEHAIKAFELDPTRETMSTLIFEAGANPKLRGTEPAHRISGVVEGYVVDFMENQDEYSGQAGYIKKLWAALIGANTLSGAYKRGNPELAEKYAAFYRANEAKPRAILLDSKW